MDGLIAAVYAAGLVFARTGAFIMLVPGFAEPGPSPRIRLAFALLLSLAVGPGVASLLPPMPDAPAALAGAVAAEVVIGLALGALIRMFLVAVSIAGQVAGMQTGLAMAQGFDPAMGQSGALFGGFLSMAAVALIFATDLHHVFLAGLRGSYALLPPGGLPPVGDFAQLSLDVMARAFAIGLQMTAPLIVFGLVFYAGVGVLSKMMPQAQIFFAAQPAMVLAGLGVFLICFGGGLLIWMDALEAFAMEFV